MRNFKVFDLENILYNYTRENKNENHHLTFLEICLLNLIISTLAKVEDANKPTLRSRRQRSLGDAEVGWEVDEYLGDADAEVGS